MAIRIWHQSFTVLSDLGAYDKALRAHFRKVARPDTEIHLHGMQPGTYRSNYPGDDIKHSALQYLHGLQFIAAALNAQAQGFDAYALSTLPEPCARPRCRRPPRRSAPPRGLLGVVINADGKRFIDEGLDFRNYTYSGMGAKVLQQPGGVAWQIFDQHSHDLLPDEYRVRQASRVQADTLQALAAKLEGVNANALLETLDEYSNAVNQTVAFNPAVRDGRSTQGLPLAKSNWANPLNSPPYVAYAVTCGITFTFGGLKVNSQGQVIDDQDVPIAGLYAAGELVGNLYYVKYAGGAGLTSGSVLGRIAGAHAACL